MKTQQRFKSEMQNVFAEEINKIALISNDDKKIAITRFGRNICLRKEQRSNEGKRRD